MISVISSLDSAVVESKPINRHASRSCGGMYPAQLICFFGGDITCSPTCILQDSIHGAPLKLGTVVSLFSEMHRDKFPRHISADREPWDSSLGAEMCLQIPIWGMLLQTGKPEKAFLGLDLVSPEIPCREIPRAYRLGPINLWK